MTGNIIKDVSVLTTIPESSLNKIFDRVEDAIIHGILESKDTDTYKANIGIGSLEIQFKGDDTKFIFEPSNRFKDKLKHAYEDKEDALIKSAEQRLIYKIVNTYKDLL